MAPPRTERRGLDAAEAPPVAEARPVAEALDETLGVLRTLLGGGAAATVEARRKGLGGGAMAGLVLAGVVEREMEVEPGRFAPGVLVRGVLDPEVGFTGDCVCLPFCQPLFLPNSRSFLVPPLTLCRPSIGIHAEQQRTFIDALPGAVFAGGNVTGFGAAFLGPGLITLHLSAGANIPKFCWQVKYLLPWTDPSFFPFILVSSTPAHSPGRKSVGPMNRTIPSNPPTSTWSPSQSSPSEDCCCVPIWAGVGRVVPSSWGELRFGRGGGVGRRGDVPGGWPFEFGGLEGASRW